MTFKVGLAAVSIVASWWCSSFCQQTDPGHEGACATPRPLATVDRSLAGRYLAEDKGLEELETVIEREDIDVPSGGLTALFVASKIGSANSVKALLEMGADPDLRMTASCCDGWTALNIASAEQHEAVVECLLHHGANPNIPNRFGRTPLMFASLYGAQRIVELLLAAKADVNAKTTAGGPSLPVLAAIERKHFEIAALLLANGATIAPEDCRSEAPVTCGLAASALERMGRSTEAKPLWARVCREAPEAVPPACASAR